MWRSTTRTGGVRTMSECGEILVLIAFIVVLLQLMKMADEEIRRRG